MDSGNKERQIREAIEMRMKKLMEKIRAIVFSDRTATFNVKYDRYTRELKELAICRKTLKSRRPQMMDELMKYKDVIYKAKMKYDWERSQPKLEEIEIESN